MKDINRKSGEGAATCPFYNEIDSILGTRAASNPVLLVDSGSESIKAVPKKADLGDLDDENTALMESEKEGVLEGNESSTATQNESSSVTGMCNMLLISYIYCLIVKLLFCS